MLIAVAVMIYFNASIQDWWGSAGFGGRRFDGTIPLLRSGSRAFSSHGRRRTPTCGGLRHGPARGDRVGNVALVGAAQAGSSGSARRWRSIVPGHPRRTIFTRVSATLPPTLPASSLRWRNGVSPADYDILRTNRFLSDPLRPSRHIDIRTTTRDFSRMDGTARSANRPSPYRWAAKDAEIRVPLDRTAPIRIDVRLHAFNFPGAAPQIPDDSGRIRHAARRSPWAATGRRRSASSIVPRGGRASTASCWHSAAPTDRWTSAWAGTGAPSRPPSITSGVTEVR